MPTSRPKTEAVILKAPLQTGAAALPHLTAAVASSMKALFAGDAEGHQQKLALDWIIRQAADRDGFHYYPRETDTAFALGRKFVGDQIVGLLHLDITVLTKKENQNG